MFRSVPGRRRAALSSLAALLGMTATTLVLPAAPAAAEEVPPSGIRLTDLGSGAVLAVVTETGRGKGSGVPVERHFAALYTVIDGKIARATVFRSEQDALEAAGLSG